MLNDTIFNLSQKCTYFLKEEMPSAMFYIDKGINSNTDVQKRAEAKV